MRLHYTTHHNWFDITDIQENPHLFPKPICIGLVLIETLGDNFSLIANKLIHILGGFGRVSLIQDNKKS